MIKQSLKFFLIGLLVWPISAEIIGFISPLWSVFVNGDSTGKTVFTLLEMCQPYLALFSIIFAYSFYLLTKLKMSLKARYASQLLAILYVCCSIYGFFPEDGITYLTLNSVHYLCELAMLYFGVLFIYNNLPEINVETNGNLVNEGS